jgi:hypothetical protein
MEFNKKFLAYCGLYCRQCSFKAAHDEQDARHLESIPYKFIQRPLSDYNCEGCKGFCICGPCKIKECASSKNIDSCADCAVFPCRYTESFANDGMPHHKSAVENLYNIRKYGIDRWFKSIARSLQCKCGAAQSWYYKCREHK